MTRCLTWLLLEPAAVRRSLLLGLAVALLEFLALLLAATVDHDFWLPEPGIGLLQHPGIPAVILADFLVLTFAAATTRKFLHLVGQLPVLPAALTRRYLRRVVRRGREAFLLRRRSLPLFLFCAGVGILFWAQNAFQTVEPVRFYGNDVFDSYQHIYSYMTFRAVLALSWIVIYPFATVIFLTVAGNLYVATQTLKEHNQLTYKTFHPDKCGGFSFIGDISFLVIMALFSLYVALITVIHTHHKLNILQIAGFLLLSVAFILVTFLISWPSVLFLLKKRRAMMRDGYRASRGSATQPLIQLLWLSTVASFSPYSGYQRLLINGSRLAPFVAAAIRLKGLI